MGQFIEIIAISSSSSQVSFNVTYVSRTDFTSKNGVLKHIWIIEGDEKQFLYYRAMHFRAKRGIAIVHIVRLCVCHSVRV